MIKRRILNALFRLRGFMQEEILAQTQALRREVEQLREEHAYLRATVDRLELFDQTAKTVENGLLSLALNQDRQELPAAHETILRQKAI